MGKQQFLGWAVVVTALATSPAARGQITYSYTLVAATGGVSPFAGVYAPSLNAAGTAAFGANLTAGGSGIFIGSGGATTTIAQTGTLFSGFVNPGDTTGLILPSINPTSNNVAFFATRTAGAGGGSGIFTGAGAANTAIASAPNFNTVFNARPAINSANTVSFTAATSTVQQVIVGNGGATTPIATSGTSVPSFVGPTAINGAGTVAFIANFSDGSQQVLVGNGGPVSPVATTGTTVPSFVGPVSINGSGTVAFVGNLSGGGQAVFAGNTSSVGTVATTGGTVTAFGDSASINSSNLVAFAAAFSSGAQTIFTGNGTTSNPVIQTGATLSGSTVQSLALGAFAFNDVGQVAFAAQLADGRQGVYVATPVFGVPEPAGVLTVAAACLALAGPVRRWRRGAAGRS
jgi:hypothetical protein